MRAKDIMSRPVHTVRADDTVERAAALLTEHDITAAPVIDGADELVGMVSEGDLLWHRVPSDPTAHVWRTREADLADRPRFVRDVMSANVVAVWPDADVADAAELMLARNVRSVPVVEDGDLLGIVSRRDILRSVVRTDDVVLRDVQQRLDAYAGAQRRWTAQVTDGVAMVEGRYDTGFDRTILEVLVRTVPGVAAVRLLGEAEPSTVDDGVRAAG